MENQAGKRTMFVETFGYKEEVFRKVRQVMDDLVSTRLELDMGHAEMIGIIKSDELEDDTWNRLGVFGNQFEPWAIDVKKVKNSRAARELIFIGTCINDWATEEAQSFLDQAERRVEQCQAC